MSDKDLFESHSAEEATAMHPPKGFAWVYNRRKDPIEWPFNGTYYSVPGHRAIMLPDIVARHGRKRTVEKIDYTLRKVQRAIAVRYHPSFGEPNDSEFGDPLDAPKPIELVDRGSSDSLLEGSAVDESGRPLPTSAKVISVRGAVVGPTDVSL